jgi:murein DD-endopeptidase MepM/ murein hydrolase activator NlpD
MKSSDFLREDDETGQFKMYMVQAGDTLSKLAAASDTTVDGLMYLNPQIKNADLISVGERIRLPDLSGVSPVVKKKPDVSTVTASGNAKTAMDYFTQQGWTPEQAAGIVANLQAESGQNLNISAVGDAGKAYGIAQWHGPRQRDFQRAMGGPLKGSSLEDQLKFVQWELTNTEKQAGARLKAAKTAAQAAATVDQYYERSSGIHRQKRIASANALVPAAA